MSEITEAENFARQAYQKAARVAYHHSLHQIRGWDELPASERMAWLKIAMGKPEEVRALRQTALTLAVQLHAAHGPQKERDGNWVHSGQLVSPLSANAVESTAASFVAYILGEEKKP